MPNNPLPKPAAPVTINPGQSQQVKSQAAASSQPQPSQPSQASQSAQPSRAAQPNQSTQSAQAAQPATTPPVVPQSPVIGGRQAPPPTTRQEPVAPPPVLQAQQQSQAQSQPAQQGSAQTSNASQPPVAGRGAGQSFSPAQTPPASSSVQHPPQTLTALESMASNTLPKGAAAVGSKPIPAATQQSPTQGAGAKTAPAAAKNGAPPPPPSPTAAEPKKSILRFLPFVIGGLILLAVIIFVAMRFMGGGTTTSVSDNGDQPASGAQVPVGQEVSLEYWGLWEPTVVMEEVIEEYQQQNAGVSISYSRQSHQDYRERLRNALVSGNGPDIFRYHATWVPMIHDELAPMPSAVMTAPEFSQTFYPIAVNQLQNRSSQIVGIPLMYDGLALYYNTEIFSTAVVDPPTTWTELRTLANQLTIRSEAGIERAGIAMGNASNTEHFSDILAVLLLQNDASLFEPNSPATRDALQFYTLFVRSDRVWNDTQPNSSVAFARGDVAMMFAPSWRVHEVKTMNPNLQFRTVPLPQLTDERITWGNYWAEGVSNFSTDKEEAWKFLKYLSSADVQKRLHDQQAEVRPFGEIYSRVDLADEIASDPYMGAYVQDARYAQGWHMSSSTHDAGINDQIIGYYEDAVTAMIEGESVDDVMPTLEQGVQQVLRQYGVTAE